MATQYTAGLTTGQVLTAATMNSIGASWETFTPSWTNLTVGNGTVSAGYGLINKIMFIRLRFTLGSTSAVGTNPFFTIPAGKSAANLSWGFGEFYDNAGTGFPMTPIASSTIVGFRCFNATGTYATNAFAAATVPFSWGNGDEISCNLILETA